MSGDATSPWRWRATYTPGSWLLLCGPSAAVVLEPADAGWSDLVETLWDEVVSADSIGDLAARLAWYRIDTMPSFAAFFWGPDGMRSLVRGAVSVVDADTGDVVANGEGVQTWVETGLGDLRQVRVELPADRPDGTFPLPLVVGAVGVSGVFLDASDEASVFSPQSGGAAPVEAPHDHGEDDRSDLDAADVDRSADGPGEEPEDLEGADAAADVDLPEELDGEPTELYPGPDAEPEPFAPADPALSDAQVQVAHENAETRFVAVPELPLDEAAPAPGVPAPAVAQVDAVLCPWGHPNPPGAGRCRVCTALVPTQAPRAVDEPVLAVLRASNGETAELRGSVLVGRAPARERARVADPGLLTVTSPSHDISRTHLEVFTVGWDVGVADLHSTNGTVLVRPDGSSRVLGAGETVVVELGSSLELADGISVLVDFPQ